MYRREDIDRVRQATSLIDLVSSVTTVRRQGRSHKAICPFHQERTASLSLDPARGLYYCFGCQAKGDVFSFVQQTQGLDFEEAVEMLARQAGIGLVADPAATRRRGEHERQVEAVRAAVEFYHRRLKRSEDAGGARRYLRGRRYDATVVETYRLGYSPETEGWDALVRELRGAGIRDEVMIEAGLARRGRGGKLYDIFRGRLLFPIFDLRGDPVGFGGRILGTGSPKYLNSPESRLYQKGALLYGLHLAKGAIARKGWAAVVEGYTDVIGCHLSGVETAVATCGTALGEEHFDLLRRFTERVVLAFDADAAGAGAALRGDQLETPVRLDLDVRVAEMPEGKDPGDLYQEGRAAELRAVLEKSIPLLRYRLEKEAARFDLTEAEGRARAVRAVRPFLLRVGDPVARHEYVLEAAYLIGVEPGILQQALEDVGGRRRRSMATTATPPGSDVEREALRVLLENPDQLSGIEVNPYEFTHPVVIRAAEMLILLRRVTPPGHRLDFGSISADEEVADLLGRLTGDTTPIPPDPTEPLVKLKRRWVERRIHELRRELNGLRDGSPEHAAALAEYSRLEGEKRRLDKGIPLGADG